MTASNPSGSFFDIVPYSSLIPSHEEVITGSKSEDCEPVRPDDQGRPEPLNPTIARLIKAVQDNPTRK